METKPNPGSEEARELGCICPILDNRHGLGAYTYNGEPVFWINCNCPLHGDKKER